MAIRTEMDSQTSAIFWSLSHRMNVHFDYISDISRGIKHENINWHNFKSPRAYILSHLLQKTPTMDTDKSGKRLLSKVYKGILKIWSYFIQDTVQDMVHLYRCLILYKQYSIHIYERNNKVNETAILIQFFIMNRI